MDELKIWWDIAQLAGAGAALVLGVAVRAVWHKWNADQDYHRARYLAIEAYQREADRNTLTVLGDLTNVLKNDSRDIEQKHTQLLGAIQQAVESIRSHVDGRLRKE